MYRILVTTDGSKHSERTIKETIKIAKPMGAAVTVLAVAEEGEHSYFSNIPIDVISTVKKDREKFFSEAADTAKNLLEQSGIEVKTVILEGNPADIICSYSEKENFDLVIMGSRRMGKVHGFLLGSVSSKVLHSTTKNVLVVR